MMMTPNTAATMLSWKIMTSAIVDASKEYQIRSAWREGGWVAHSNLAVLWRD
jgi:hypothetical protein